MAVEKAQEVSNQLTTKGKTHSMELIFFPLFILIFTGMLANTFSSSGVQTNPVYPATCQAVAICYPTNKNGCDSAVNPNCNLSSTSRFSFLNANSPFTGFFTGNVGEFANAFSANSQNSVTSSQPFIYFQNASATDNLKPNDSGTIILGVCQNINGTNWFGPNGGSGGLNIKLSCDQIFLNSTQVPQAESKLFPAAFPLTASLNCTSFSSGSSAGTTTPWVYLGCDAKWASPLWAKFLIVAVNATSELFAAQASPASISLYTFILFTNQQSTFASSQDPTYCALIVGFGGPFISKTVAPTTLCTSWGQAIKQSLPLNAPSQFAGILLLGFFVGVIFLILGLGIGLNVGVFTNSLGFTPDSQGTKLMQVLGIGLTTWTFVYSEFGLTWIPNLPLGIDAIVTISLSFTFFLGLYWRLFTLD